MFYFNFWGGWEGGEVHALSFGHVTLVTDEILLPSKPRTSCLSDKDGDCSQKLKTTKTRSPGQRWWRHSLLTHSFREFSALYANTKNEGGWEVPSDSAKAGDVEQAPRAATEQPDTTSLQLRARSRNAPPTSFLLLIHENYGHLHTMELKRRLNKTCYFVSCMDPWILLPFFVWKTRNSARFNRVGKSLSLQFTVEQGHQLMSSSDKQVTTRLHHVAWVAITP